MALFSARSDDEHHTRRSVPQGIGAILLTILAVILLYSMVAYVPAGHVGVLTLFGRVTGEVLPEGTHLVNPFKVNNTMSIRTQEQKETASVPSSEGLIISLDTSLLFRLSAAAAVAPKTYSCFR
jgi:regulator of protease activity HflC (stomatin/prohibitin superfamily)